MFRRQRSSTPAARQPDANPVIEARLQQLDELERQSEVKRGQITAYRGEIDLLHQQLRGFQTKAIVGAGYQSGKQAQEQIPVSEKRVKNLQAEIRQLESDIQTNQDRIVQVHEDLEQKRHDLIYGHPAAGQA